MRYAVILIQTFSGLSDLIFFFCSQVQTPQTLKIQSGPPRQRGHENWDDWQQETCL